MLEQWNIDERAVDKFTGTLFTLGLISWKAWDEISTWSMKLRSDEW